MQSILSDRTKEEQNDSFDDQHDRKIEKVSTTPISSKNDRSD